MSALVATRIFEQSSTCLYTCVSLCCKFYVYVDVRSTAGVSLVATDALAGGRFLCQ